MFLSKKNTKFVLVLALAVTSSVSAIGCGVSRKSLKKKPDTSKNFIQASPTAGGGDSCSGAQLHHSDDVVISYEPNQDETRTVLQVETADQDMNFLVFRCDYQDACNAYTCNLRFILQGINDNQTSTLIDERGQVVTGTYLSRDGKRDGAYDERRVYELWDHGNTNFLVLTQ